MGYFIGSKEVLDSNRNFRVTSLNNITSGNPNYSSTNPALVATLNNPEPTSSDNFSRNSIAISGNYVVVGAYQDDPGGVSGAGTAYVFNATTGALITTLNNPNPTANDFFGFSVAISGNYAVVSSHLDDPGGVTDAGTAYVFNATTGALITTLSNPAPAVDDVFGHSVAISGNYAVVGAYLDDPGGVSAAGTAYVFNATTGAHVATLNNPAPAVDDVFGFSVAISGNYAVVGAPYDNYSGVGLSGIAYVFNATTGALVATLNNPAPGAADYFGDSVAISGNYAVVGAWQDDPGGVFNIGTVYVFNATTGALVATLNNPEPTAFDYFGVSVSISGNYVVVGAYQDDPGGISNVGIAYVFNATTGALVATLNNPEPTATDYFGDSAAISGNYAVVGAYLDDPGGVDSAGTAYTFNISGYDTQWDRVTQGLYL